MSAEVFLQVAPAPTGFQLAFGSDLCQEQRRLRIIAILVGALQERNRPVSAATIIDVRYSQVIQGFFAAPGRNVVTQ